MQRSIRPGQRGREPDNELYDRGSDLVEAAAAIRRAAASREAVRAIPAVLGCVEAALQELLWAVAALEVTTAAETDQRSRRHGDPRMDRSRDRMHVGYANLERSLSDAQQAASAARALAHRALETGRAAHGREPG